MKAAFPTVVDYSSPPPHPRILSTARREYITFLNIKHFIGKHAHAHVLYVYQGCNKIPKFWPKTPILNQFRKSLLNKKKEN